MYRRAGTIRGRPSFSAMMWSLTASLALAEQSNAGLHIRGSRPESSCVRADGSANASCFGFHPADSTTVLQQAFASGASMLSIDDVYGHPWVVTPLILENVTNLVVIVEPGVVVLAKEGAFHGGGDCLLLFRNCRNVTLTSRPGATAGERGILRMRREDYADPSKYKKAEWRMAVRLDETARDINILNLHITESGGDGIFVAGATNVHVSDCLVDKHYRQGMSVISARSLLVEKTIFADTNGTEPSAGIDIEPDASVDGLRPELSNVTIRQCECINNAGGGLLMSLAALNATTPPISIAIQNLTVDGRFQHGPGVTIGNVKQRLAGRISISNSRVQNTRGCGLTIYKKEAAGAFAELRNVTFVNVARAYPLRPGHTRRSCDPTGACSPILMVGGTDRGNVATTAMGDVSFERCVVHDDINRPFLRASNQNPYAGTSYEVTRVRGTFDVFNPFGCNVTVQKNQSGVAIDTRCHDVLQTT